MNDHHIELFTGKDGQWYWRRIAGNGEQVSGGSEGYVRKIDCLEEAENVNPGLEVRETDE
jgi:uncharacterized protein YegP (UPF0339 family)